MNQIRATLVLYKDCAVSASRGLARTGLALLALFLATPILVVAAQAAERLHLGIVGGFAVAFLHAAVVGWYLSLVEIGVEKRGKVLLSDLPSRFGQYMWEVISILFIFWIAGMLLMLVPQVQLVAVLVATLVFNPIPEMIYQERERSLGLLTKSVRFMQEAWPEWLVVHALMGCLLVAWGWLITGTLTASLAVSLLQLFGPWFGFVEAGALSIELASLSLTGILNAVVVLVLVHWFMLYRGQLYRQLKTSTRRSRAWKARH